MRVIIGIIIIIILAFVGYYLVMQGGTEPSPRDEQPATTTDQGQADQPSVVGENAAWETFESGQLTGGFTFTVEHPQPVEAENPADDVYSFTYVGPASEPNTEITDGFYLVLQAALADTLDAYVSSTEPNGTPQRVTFNGNPAERFTTTSELGTQPQHIAFVLAEQGEQVVVIDVSYTLSGTQDARARYQRTVDRMLSTLTFEQASSGGDPSDRIRINQPATGETVKSPLVVTGEARGMWYFEATFPIVVTDWDGRIIGEGYAEAQSDWMTEDFVPFRGTIEYDADAAAASSRGTVIFQRSNPSGLPENDAGVEVPVMLDEVQ